MDRCLILFRDRSYGKVPGCEAAGHLGRIVSEGTSKLTGAIWKASVSKVGVAVTGASGYAKDAGSKLWAKVSSRRFDQPEVG